MPSESLKGIGWVISVTLAIVLALAAMGWLVYRYSFLESEAIILGLWVFFSILFLDIFAIILFIFVFECRAGEGRTAVKLAGVFLLLGFLAASVMGLLAYLAVAATANPWLLLLVVLLPSLFSGIYKMWAWLQKHRTLRESHR